MPDEYDRVIEGTMSNVFVRVDDRLYTPRIDEVGVERVTRTHVLPEVHAQAMPLRDSVPCVVRVASLNGRRLAQTASVRTLQERISNVVAV